MVNRITALLFVLFCIASTDACIDPYPFHLDKYKSLLVVEGLITNENAPYEVTLSRTFQSTDSAVEKISDAIVYVTDQGGNRNDFNYSCDGKYISANTSFTGMAGSTYTLHIQTSDGNKYESEPCLMIPVTGINSLYFEKEEHINSITNQTLTGIEVYLDSEEGEGSESYYRWTYNETWEHMLPIPRLFDYISETQINAVNNVSYFCWKSDKSNDILTGSTVPGQKNIIMGQPILFIASGQSDRLNNEYILNVTQMSVSEKEFGFWNNLNKINETGGTIFDTQPYPIISNIFNINDPDEKVLGYFSVSSVSHITFFITAQDLNTLDLPPYQYNCNEIYVSPSDYSSPNGSMSFDFLYNAMMQTGKYSFIEPFYDDMNQLIGLGFAPVECSECSPD
ncbi:MAG: DUF4249 domain-containing protein [Bacteroidales bacterium]|jgi:hypothetical protein